MESGWDDFIGEIMVKTSFSIGKGSRLSITSAKNVGMINRSLLGIITIRNLELENTSALMPRQYLLRMEMKLFLPNSVPHVEGG